MSCGKNGCCGLLSVLCNCERCDGPQPQLQFQKRPCAVGPGARPASAAGPWGPCCSFAEYCHAGDQSHNPEKEQTVETTIRHSCKSDTCKEKSICDSSLPKTQYRLGGQAVVSVNAVVLTPLFFPPLAGPLCPCWSGGGGAAPLVEFVLCEGKGCSSVPLGLFQTLWH